MVIPWGNNGVAWRKRSCKEQCQVHAGEEYHARPGWTTSWRGQDSPRKGQSEWQSTEINGESTSMVWPTLESRTAKDRVSLGVAQIHRHHWGTVRDLSARRRVKSERKLQRRLGTGILPRRLAKGLLVRGIIARSGPAAGRSQRPRQE